MLQLVVVQLVIIQQVTIQLVITQLVITQLAITQQVIFQLAIGLSQIIVLVISLQKTTQGLGASINHALLRNGKMRINQDGYSLG